MGDDKSLADHVRDVEREYPDSDVLAYLGPVVHPFDEEFVSLCEQHGPPRKNLILILSTLGGDTVAAYRIARCIQRRWGLLQDRSHAEPAPKVSVFVGGGCASAGTLIALGATELIMSESAELRPLDVRWRGSDEASDHDIGLTPNQAIDILERRFNGLFKEYCEQLRLGVDLVRSTRGAIDVASAVTTTLLAPIYDQLDPTKVAVAERRLQTAAAYGERLARFNVKPGALTRLLTGYPSPRFVIDRSEAEELFQTVVLPKPALAALGEFLRRTAVSEHHALKLFLTAPMQAAGSTHDEATLQPMAASVAHEPAETVEPSEQVHEVRAPERFVEPPRRQAPPLAASVTHAPAEAVQSPEPVREVRAPQRFEPARRPVPPTQVQVRRTSIQDKVAAVWHKEIYS